MAQKKNAGPASSLKKFYGVLGAVAVVGLVAILWIVFKSRTGTAAMEPVEVAGADNPQALVEKAQGVSLGENNAPVKMLVFSDYQCPYCARFALEIEPLLIQEFVNTGKLQFVYYDFPLGGGHRYSFLVSRAARCAGDQNEFWDYQNMVYAKQSEWAYDESVPMGKLLDYGKEVGLNGGQFEQCVKSEKYADIVSANRLLGDQLLVNATPTIFVNGRKVPGEAGLDIKYYRELINSAAGPR